MTAARTRHRGMPLAEWPVADRKAWRRAFGSPDAMDRPMCAAFWSETTSRGVQGSYGRWLRWLGDRDAACLARPPPDRACEAAAAAYAAALGNSLAKISVAAALIDISRALKVIAPRAEVPWLDRMAARLRREARPTRGKESRLVPTADLLKLGRELMSRAASDTGVSMPGRATLHRDGLMIAVLALRPLRLANYLAIEMGRHLVVREGRAWIYFDGHETKNRAPIASPFPITLSRNLERYLAVWRPLLAARNPKSGGDARRSGTGLLWLSRSGQGVSRNAFYSMTRTRTAVAFGKQVNPNLFRDCLATTLAREEDDVSWTIRHVLGHRSAATAETYYNHARGLRDLDRFQKHVETLRKPSRGK